MTRGRPRTPIGTFGQIAVTDLGGRYRALTRFRDVDGRLRKVSATAATRRGAEATLKARLAGRAGPGTAVRLGVATGFAELCELWLADLAHRDISEGTKQNYRDDLRRYVRPALAQFTLGEITTGRVESFLRAEAAVSYSRAKHARTLLNQLFDFALRHDAIARNPVAGTSPLSRPQRDVRALTLDEVQAIRAAAAGWRTGPDVKGPRPDGTVRDICEVLLGTSMRPGEVLALRPCDVTDTAEGMTVHVRGTVVRRTGRADSRQDHAKTDASTRQLAVPDFAAQVLRRRIGQTGPDQAQTIFHNRDGGVISLHNLRRTFRAFLAEAGLADSGITPRWYRRTGATVLARGLGVDAAAAFLGHTNAAVTQAHYIQADPAVDRSPAAVLDLTLRPDRPDGALLAQPVDTGERAMLDVLDQDRTPLDG
ncbi:tyrosine-type recombinase/integrase [Actinotalea sp. Marseille-Q4924]|uniref:tyrosine-type recombinase/integrase n=1 Tax=Actinotalea sp. Marseille-Q4924 TaxID=2866571 RepID=UPI001CE48458|nr:tyrosine-type recombinase/integrase [Actinotalea sp. Marseille-Q4924]